MGNERPIYTLWRYVCDPSDGTLLTSSVTLANPYYQTPAAAASSLIIEGTIPQLEDYRESNVCRRRKARDPCPAAPQRCALCQRTEVTIVRMWDTLVKCWQLRPSDRLTIDQVIDEVDTARQALGWDGAGV